MNGPVTIEADRLILREMAEDDRKAVHAYMSLRETVSFSSYDPWTEDEARDFVSRAVRRRQEHVRHSYTLAAFLKRSGCLIGDFGLIVKGPGIAAVGMTVNPDHWGNGYATEAVRALLDFGFRELGLNVIHAVTRRLNVAARCVLEKSGMSPARFSIDLLGKNVIGLLDRSMGYAIAREDWTAARNRHHGTASVTRRVVASGRGAARKEIDPCPRRPRSPPSSRTWACPICRPRPRPSKRS